MRDWFICNEQALKLDKCSHHPERIPASKEEVMRLLYLQKSMGKLLYRSLRVCRGRSLLFSINLPQQVLPSEAHVPKKAVCSPGKNQVKPPNGANVNTEGAKENLR